MPCETASHQDIGTSATSPHKGPRRVRRCPRGWQGAPSGPVVVDRYYDPATGQFLSVDPKVQQSQQAYVYAGDDPVRNTDPSGLAIFPHCHGTGSKAAACDLGFMAHTDFPALSASHIALILSAGSFGSIAGLLIQDVLEAFLLVSLAVQQRVRLPPAAAWAWNVGSPDVNQILLDMRSTKLVVFVDKYEAQSKAVLGIGGGLNAFLDTKVAKDPTIQGISGDSVRGDLQARSPNRIGLFTNIKQGL